MQIKHSIFSNFCFFLVYEFYIFDFFFPKCPLTIGSWIDETIKWLCHCQLSMKGQQRTPRRITMCKLRCVHFITLPNWSTFIKQHLEAKSFFPFLWSIHAPCLCLAKTRHMHLLTAIVLNNKQMKMSQLDLNSGFWWHET